MVTSKAHNNVLFLDELHQLSLSAQAKLLRFLQEMKFRRVGDGVGKEISINFKLLAAVQPDIEIRIEDGRFLPDLIARISELRIIVPPLRERPDDIEPLVRKFQNEFNEGIPLDQRKQFHLLTVEAMTKLPWERNVRSLGAAVKQLLMDYPASIVEPADLKKYLKTHFLTKDPPTPTEANTHSEAKHKFEWRLFVDALSSSKTRSEAAKQLNMPLSTFTRKLKDIGIEPALYLLADTESNGTRKVRFILREKATHGLGGMEEDENCSSLKLVDPTGIEPVTSNMPC